MSPKVMSESPKALAKSQGRSLARLREEFLDDLRSEGRSPNTIKWYGARLEYLEREMDIRCLHELTKDVINQFLKALSLGRLPDSRKNASDAYKANCWRAFKAFIYWCRRNGYALDDSLFNEEKKFSLRRPKEEDVEMEIFTAEEIDQLRQVGLHIGTRERLIIEVLLSTGVRIHEAIQIELEDIQGPNLRVRGKGRKVRYPPLASRLQKMLTVYIRKYRPDSPSNRLFLKDDGQPLSQAGLDSLLKRMGKRTGIHCNAHKFRHTFATEYLRANPGQMEKLRMILGHSDYKVLMRYVHLSAKDLSDGYDNEDPFA